MYLWTSLQLYNLNQSTSTLYKHVHIVDKVKWPPAPPQKIRLYRFLLKNTIVWLHHIPWLMIKNWPEISRSIIACVVMIWNLYLYLSHCHYGRFVPGATSRPPLWLHQAALHSASRILRSELEPDFQSCFPQWLLMLSEPFKNSCTICWNWRLILRIILFLNPPIPPKKSIQYDLLYDLYDSWQKWWNLPTVWECPWSNQNNFNTSCHECN